MSFIDTHCHLSDAKLAGQVDSVLIEAASAEVATVIVPSTSFADAKKVLELTKIKGVFGLVGIHPEELESISDLSETVKQLEQLIDNEKIVGIGEIGLDFHHDTEHKTENRQLGLYLAQMQLAAKHHLPAVIHMRDADKEMLAALNTLSKLPTGQFHCFAGNQEFLEQVLNWGFYISFCGNLTYKNAENLRQLCAKVPLDRLLLETDSPYLSPEGRRGQINTPANVKITSEFIAKIKQVSLEELAAITTNNAQRLFVRLRHEILSPPNQPLSGN